MYDLSQLICIFGMPRSGTTWVGKIFDSHPDTLYRHEPDSGRLRGGFLAGCIPLLAGREQGAALANDVAEITKAMLATRNARASGKTPFFPKSYLSALRFQIRRLVASAVAAGSRIRPDLTIPDLVDNVAGARIRPVWKSINLVGCVGCLAAALAQARFIVIVRHPCGQVNSVLRGEAARKFTAATPASRDWGLYELLLNIPVAQKYGLVLADIKAMEPVERLTWRWVLFNEQAVIEARALPNCRVIRYEDICERPLDQARDLFAFVDLPWSHQAQAFVAASTQGGATGYYSVYKSPAVAANKWRTELGPDKARKIMNIVGQTPLASLFNEGGENCPTDTP